ncbi:hypothetical protein ACFY1B_12095 [Streptomyces mirabilis]|uniref:hypothetical protein n=1 Tax=Streptomyces mirabilis TaxID=68239 RepID=UPI0036A412C1
MTRLTRAGTGSVKIPGKAIASSSSTAITERAVFAEIGMADTETPAGRGSWCRLTAEMKSAGDLRVWITPAPAQQLPPLALHLQMNFR